MNDKYIFDEIEENQGKENLNKNIVICIIPTYSSKLKKGGEEDFQGTIPLSKGSAQNPLEEC